MGCDIHVYIEVLTKNGWELYAHPEVSRNYSMFGKIAGVRDDSVDPISLPKGLPSDISYITKMAAETRGDGGHSHSWLNADEIAQLEAWYCQHPSLGYFEDTFGYLECNGFDNHSFPAWIHDVRFVFWFDN